MVVVEEMQEPMGCGERIFVSVRLRPLNNKEIDRHDVCDWECISDNTIIYRNSLYPTAYTYDRVFSSDCPNRQVYEEGAKEIALSVVRGINSTVFAYGQTTSGKTYTMTGITEYAMADIYDYIQRHKERGFILKFSAMEIYNELARDLLSVDGAPLQILDDPESGTVVDGLTEETLRDWNHFKELLSICEAQRQIGETSLNETSSRSHQILRVTVESSAREFLGNDKSSTLVASVNFVDLAGSERASQTSAAGARLKEGCHINRGLLTLGTVIRKLSKGRNEHIPYRDSKLTRILQSSLGGNARTAIICTMSPARIHVEQSRKTLLFASCAKEVTANARVNLVMSDKALVKKFQRELARLENELRIAGTKPTSSIFDALLREKDLEIEKLKKEVAILIQQRDLAWSVVEGMRQAADNESPRYEKPVKVGSDSYPKLRVRDRDSLSIGFRSHSPSERQSFGSEENFLQLPDFKLTIPCPSASSPQMSPRIPVFVGGTFRQEENNYENSEVSCKEVCCIDSNLSVNRYSDSSFSECRPKIHQYNSSSPRESSAISGVIEVDNEDISKQESKPLHLNKNIVFAPTEKTYLFELKDEPCSCRRSRFTRSRSCKASLMTCSQWIEKLEANAGISPMQNAKDFTGTPYNFDRKSSESKLDPQSEAGELIRNESPTSSTSATLNELNESQSSFTSAAGWSVPIPENKNSTDFRTSTGGSEEMSCNNKYEDQHDDYPTMTPTPETYRSSSAWSSEFKRIQGEIIELWHACNVSLVHRTYFFLLFKGDTKDFIYLEVEHRRLSFLKNVFTNGKQMVENGRVLTRASSEKALRRERQMLSQRMSKRLSKAERDNLFLKWGIELNVKQRRLKLANLLWSDCKDTERIAESAAIVAKLVGFENPEKTFKEMFGLNFTPEQHTPMRNKTLKRSVMSLL
ncbi:hypothetical protein like AT5G66310 [Hibiscus trionum]|uniref:Kinesin-like protein n=1 Tax=Hibiscus trionum TaxID=183268 RepID=A0A9W7H2D8_HIBTR|nr:hypothetical protein like AT5G66310 [Hibiscus trionum]